MGAPVKRKREQQQEASTSTQVASKPLENISWHSILANIQGQKGEPGAIEGAFLRSSNLHAHIVVHLMTEKLHIHSSKSDISCHKHPKIFFGLEEIRE